MKIKSDITRKLLNYSCLSAGVIGVHTNLNGQVHYNNIDPDELLYQYVNDDEGWKYADLDDDGVNDVGLHFEAGYSCGYCPGWVFFQIDLLDDTEIATAMGIPCNGVSTYSSTCYFPSIEVADVLLDGELLSPAHQFGDIDYVFKDFDCGYPYGIGCRQGFFGGSYGSLDEQFFGFRKTNIDTNLCWLRLYWDDASLYMTGAACELQPNTAIEMKNVPDIILENEEPDIWQMIHIFSQDDYLTINGNISIIGAQYQLISMDGRIVSAGEITDNSFSIKTDMSSGIYVVRLQHANSVYAQEVFIK